MLTKQVLAKLYSPIFEAPWMRRWALLAFALLFWLGGCATGAKSQLVGLPDALYRGQKTMGQHPNPKSPGVQFYQSVVSSALSTDCQQYPVDSVYAQQVNQDCGSLSGTWRAIARVLQEPSASELGLPAFVWRGKVFFEDQPEHCHVE